MHVTFHVTKPKILKGYTLNNLTTFEKIWWQLLTELLENYFQHYVQACVHIWKRSHSFMSSDNINFSLQGKHDYLTYLVHTTLHGIMCSHYSVSLFWCCKGGHCLHLQGISFRWMRKWLTGGNRLIIQQSFKNILSKAFIASEFNKTSSG